MDNMRQGPDHRKLFEIASGQLGYFTATQAHSVGFSWSLLSHYATSGRFTRVRQGVYRIHDYPSSPHEEEMTAWLTIGKERAVVSHESALNLLDLSDTIPNTIHLTVPRSRRHVRRPAGITIHTTTRPLNTEDVAMRSGIRVTSPARSILDTAEAGTSPEQVVLAARQAIQRGLATSHQLCRDARTRSQRVTDLIFSALAETSADV